MFEKIKQKMKDSAVVRYVIYGMGLFLLYMIGRVVLSALGVI